MKLLAMVLSVLLGSFSFALAQSGSGGSSSGTSSGTAGMSGSNTTGNAAGTSGQATNSSQADYNSSLRDGSAPGSSNNPDANHTTVGAGSGGTLNPKDDDDNAGTANRK